ncbi:toprim domain-containing protein [Aeromonas jandaei]|uniref:toprim domain-containing protein n=1 Tax=Aeromonas jandaei TaxID=650 RepID=UPI003BA124CC
MDLIIIEAPGKLRRIYELSRQARLSAKVIATLGHLFDNPKQVTIRAIAKSDGEYTEPLRTAVRPDVLRRIEHEISQCSGRILIATDIDREGHVIADDILNHCDRLGIKKPILRMKLSSLNLADFQEALAQLAPLVREDAIPGHARRITDRLITEHWSDFSNYLPVGRVQTAALSMLNEIPVSLHSIHRNIAATAGAPFQCSMAIPPGKTPADLIKELDASPPLPVSKIVTEPLLSPPTGDDCIMAVSTELNLSITDAAKLLQDMYEQGHISYHRSIGKGYSDTTRNQISTWAIGRGILLCKQENLPSSDPADVHEAVHVLHWDDVDITKPFALQRSKQDAALAVIARMNISSGIKVQKEYADTTAISHMSSDIKASRQQRVLLPWAAPTTQSVTAHAPDQALFSALVNNGLGTASTRPLLVDKLLNATARTAYLTPDLQLTTKGLAILEQAPPALQDRITSQKIEAILSSPSERITELVEAALHLVVDGDEDALSKVLDEIDEQPEQALKMRLR